MPATLSEVMVGGNGGNPGGGVGPGVEITAPVKLAAVPWPGIGPAAPKLTAARVVMSAKPALSKAVLPPVSDRHQRLVAPSSRAKALSE